MKTIGGMRRMKYRSRYKFAWMFALTAAAYNLIRLPKLLQAPTCIVEMPDNQDDYPNMVEPAYIQFSENGGEFAFGCITGAIHGIVNASACEFTWSGNDEMDEACGDGWAQLQEDGILEGDICFQNGDEAAFIARRWDNSSTAC